MFKEDYFIQYAKLVLENPKGIVDKGAEDILGINLEKLNPIISYLKSESLIIRFEDESAKSPVELPKWKPLMIAVEVKNNASKPSQRLSGWLRKEQEKLKEKNIGRFTLLLSLFLGIFNLGFSLIPNIIMEGKNISWVFSLLVSLLICGVVYKKI